MVIFGINKVSMLVSISVTIFTIVIWLLREWSWSSYQHKMQLTLNKLQESNDNLFLQLQIEEAAQPMCATNETEAEFSMPNSTNHVFISNLENQLLHPAPVFFDLSGLAQLCIFCVLILLEFYYLHLPHLSLAGDNPTEQSIRRELQDFLLKKHPVTNILIFSTIAVLSLLAWWNLLPRTTYLDIAFKVLISVAVSSPIAFVTHNIIRIKQYFPTDKEAWGKAVKDVSWWIWLVSRIIGAYDIKSASKTAVWLFCVCWYVWPVRYFFYYRFISCTPSDPGECKSTGFRLPFMGETSMFPCAVDGTFASNNIFYVNMLAQGAILLVCCNIAYLLTMLKAMNVISSESNNGDAKKKSKKGTNSTYTTGMGINSSLYGIIGVILRKIDNANAVALLALFSLCNSLLAILRVLWFCVFSTCSWYAVLVACMFIHTHIGVTMYALPSVNALMQKYSTIDTYRDAFVEQFHAHQKELDPKKSSGTHQDASQQEQEQEQFEENDFTAQEIFNKVLTDSVLFYLFVYTKPDASDNKDKDKTADSSGGEKKEASDSNLSVIFQAFLQTAAFSYQQQDHSGEEQDAEDPPAGGAGGNENVAQSDEENFNCEKSENNKNNENDKNNENSGVSTEELD